MVVIWQNEKRQGVSMPRLTFTSEALEKTKTPDVMTSPRVLSDKTEFRRSRLQQFYEYNDIGLQLVLPGYASPPALPLRFLLPTWPTPGLLPSKRASLSESTPSPMIFSRRS